LSILARLKPDAGISQGQSEMFRYTQHSADTSGQGNHSFHPQNHPIVLAGFQEEIVKTVRRAMLVLLGAVGFVLLIACVNVANLLLARAEARRREIAVRAAIGAGLGKLLQQFVIEGVILSLAGALFGMLLAFGGLRLLVATNAGSIPRVDDRCGLAGAALRPAVSVVTGVAFGWPLIHARRRFTLRLSRRPGAPGARAANRFRRADAGELALALVLLIGSGLMVKAFSEWRTWSRAAPRLPHAALLPTVSYRDATAVNAFYWRWPRGSAPCPGGLRRDRRGPASLPHQCQRHPSRRLVPCGGPFET
jgi:hypothetical protein